MPVSEMLAIRATFINDIVCQKVSKVGAIYTAEQGAKMLWGELYIQIYRTDGNPDIPRAFKNFFQNKEKLLKYIHLFVSKYFVGNFKICLHTIKLFPLLLSIACPLLNGFKYCYQRLIIPFNINHLFAHT